LRRHPASLPSDGCVQDSLFSKQVASLVKHQRLSATYQQSNHVYTPKVHAAIQDAQVQTFYDGNGFIEFRMLENLGIRGAPKVMSIHFDLHCVKLRRFDTVPRCGGSLMTRAVRQKALPARAVAGNMPLQRPDCRETRWRT
jgi:hypothetical protein